MQFLVTQVNKRFSVSLLNIYEQTIRNQNKNRDLKQVEVIHDLQRLNDQLVGTHHSWKMYAQALKESNQVSYANKSPPEQKEDRRKGFFDFFSKNSFSTARNIRVRGLYLYGGSGSGKSFLSQIFYNHLAIQEKRKLHFHEFMASIHAQLFQLQKQKKGFDPLTIVAQRTAKKTRLLYLDQFQVTDVGDASILKRLFERLINNEMVLLATTNRPPKDLYKDGHQRQFFLPFIDFISEACIVKDINSTKDYRYELERDQSELLKTYISPVSHESDATVKKVVSALTGQKNAYWTQTVVEPIQGRKLTIPKTCNHVCVYNFNELMESTMGDSDFRAICKNFKAIVIRDMRQIKREERNIANRLIKLFDEAYFRNVKLYIQAQVSMQQLINPLPEKQALTEEDFAMIRCKSRLMQFQTINYKEKLSYVEEQALKESASASKTKNDSNKQEVK